MKCRQLLILLVIWATVSCSQNQNYITDLIKPVVLNEGIATRVVLSDLFYSENYDVNFLQNNHFDVLIDSESNTVEIKPLNNFSGLDLISFNLSEMTYQIPVKLVKKQMHSFSYEPQGSVKNVNLFGQFNSWNRDDLPMEDEDGDGIYNISVPLDPGRYEYKFFVDGAELIDPLNPIKVPNGFGDFNSVLVIDKPASGNIYLHLLGYENKERTISLNFYYDTINKDLISKTDVIALKDNFKIDPENIHLNGNEISLIFNKKEIRANKVIRLAISKNGRATNFQTIRLQDGVPSTNKQFSDWSDAIIYSVMIDRFNDGDSTNDKPIKHPELSVKANYQGGDLQGIIDKIKDGYFDSLGVNTFWISPIVDNTNNAYREFPPPHRFFTGYHGYWPISATRVEEHFGDMQLAKKFVKTAHDHGMKVLLDYIAHHVHEENPLWKEHRDWFGVLELPDGRKNLRLFDEQRLTTWFEPYMPSFDYVRSEDALNFMTDNAVWWLKETGADGFRHDAVKHVPNKFWRILTRKIRAEIEIPENTNVYQVGETFGGIDLISSYVNNGQLSAQFNFNLYDVAIPVFLNKDNSFELLDLQMQKTFSVYGVNHLMANIMDSHDKIRYMAYADGDMVNSNDAKELGWNNPPKVDNPSSYKKLQLHLAYLLTIPGVPVIYYGDEIGMTGAADPDNRRMMRFDDNLNKYEKETLKKIRQLLNIRKSHSALRQGDFLTLLANECCYAYIRSDMNERVLTILNKSEDVQKVQLNLPQIYDLTDAVDISDGHTYNIINSEFLVEVNGISWQIFNLR